MFIRLRFNSLGYGSLTVTIKAPKTIPARDLIVAFKKGNKCFVVITHEGAPDHQLTPGCLNGFSEHHIRVDFKRRDAEAEIQFLPLFSVGELLSNEIKVTPEFGLLDIEVLGADSISLSWNSTATPSTAVFKAFVNYVASSTCAVPDRGGALGCVIGGLLGNTIYKVQLYLCTGSEELSPCEAESPLNLVRTRPSKPSPVVFTAVNSVSAKAAWQPIDGSRTHLKNYIVQALPTLNASAATIQCLLPADVSPLCCMLTGLTPSTLYKVYVSVCSAAFQEHPSQCSDASDAVELATTPLNPENVVVFDKTDSSMWVRWTHASETTKQAHGFLAIATQVLNPAEGSYSCEVVLAHPASECQFVGLKPRTPYKITVKAYSVAGSYSCASGGDIHYTLPSAPLDVVVSNVLTKSFQITWTPLRDVKDNSYRYLVVAQLIRDPVINVSSAEGGITAIPMSGAVRCETTGSSCIVDGLQPDTVYAVSVKVCAEVGLCSAFSVPVNQMTAPLSPINIYIDNVTDTRAQVSWGTVDKGDSTSYTYVATAKPLSNGQVVECECKVQVGILACVLRDLRPETNYSVTVKACTLPSLCSIPSTSSSFFTRPPEPQNIEITHITGESVQISWSPVPGVSKAYSYQVMVETDGGLVGEHITCAASGGTSSSCVANGLQPNSRYRVTVQTCAHLKLCSDQTPWQAFQTLPSTPTGVSFTNLTSISMLVTWNGSSEDTNKIAYNYIVVAKPTDGDVNAAQACTSNGSLLCRILHLSPDTEYTVTVRACAERLACSALSTPIQARTLPSKKGTLYLTAVDSFTLNATWSSQTHDSSSHFSLLNNDSAVVTCSQPANQTNYTCLVGGLAPHTTYVLQVNLCSEPNAKGSCSSASQPERATTLPSEPRGVTLGIVTSTSIQVVVKPTVGGKGKKYDYVIMAGSAVSVHTCIAIYSTRAQTSCLLSGLQPNTPYKVTAKTCTSGLLCSLPAGPASAHTLPEAPSNVGAVNVTSMQMLVTWTRPEEDSKNSYTYKAVATPIKSVTSGVQSCSPVKSGHSTSCLLHSLWPTTAYSIQVRACTASKLCSAQSAPYTVTTPPSVPSSLTVTKVTATTATVAWVSVPTISDTYIVTASPSNGASGDVRTCRHSLSPQAAQLCSLEHLQSNTPYAITIQHCGIADRCSPVSNPVHTITLPDGEFFLPTFFSGKFPNFLRRQHRRLITSVSIAPQPVSISEVTADSARIAWNTPSHGSHFAYIVRVNGALKNRTHACSLSSDDSALSCVVRNLKPNNDYIATVRACAAPGRCSLSSVGEPLRTLPGPPIEVEASNATAYSVVVSWKNPWIKRNNRSNDPLHYTATAMPASNGGFTGSQSCYTRGNGAEHIYCTITGLQSVTSYNVTVVVCTSADICSPPSRAVSTTTLSQTPGGVEATKITSNSITVTWVNVLRDETIIYNVKATPSSNISGAAVETCSAQQTGHQPTCLLTHLQPDTPYLITVEACTTQNLCTPVDVRATNLTSKTSVVAWTPSLDDKNSQYKYVAQATPRNVNTRGPFTCKVPAREGTFTCTIVNLLPNSEYNVSVLACNTFGLCSKQSESVHIRTLPQEMEQLYVEIVSSSGLEVKWKSTVKRSNAYFQVQLDADIITNCTKPMSNLDFACKVHNLQPDTEYELQLFTCDTPYLNAACEPASDLVKAQTWPHPPSDVVALYESATGVRVSWSLSNADVKIQYTYEVTMTPAPGVTGAKVRTCISNSLSCLVSALKPNTPYMVTMRSCARVNYCGLPTSAVDVRTPPSVPRQVGISDVQFNSLHVYLNNSEEGMRNIYYYLVVVSTRGANSVANYYCKISASVQVPSCTVGGLKPSTVYSIVVRACAADAHCSQPSQSFEAKTKPTAVTSVSVSSETSNSFIVSWTRSPEYTDQWNKYVAQVRTSDGNEVQSCSTSGRDDELSCLISRLPPNRPYTVTVIACSDVCYCSVPSGKAYAYTLPGGTFSPMSHLTCFQVCPSRIW
ncbi:unnamed protein product [Schistocephalus solidus]|uniref:Fibronectin type III domain n=1 Tax=Schistocephalus solidus TaxID=70667 RepID=A0A183SQ40_SCHSO|nr:unnamed protein product [Schistocephalus solidus]